MQIMNFSNSHSPLSLSKFNLNSHQLYSFISLYNTNYLRIKITYAAVVMTKHIYLHLYFYYVITLCTYIKLDVV